MSKRVKGQGAATYLLQMHCSLSVFKVCYVLHQDTKTDGASIRWSVFGSDVFVQVFALILWCCFTQTRSNPESAHAVDRSFQSLWWGASPSWREDILAYWLCISVTEWIKTQLPQKFMPRLTFSLNLIQDLLFLVVIWERQSKQIKAVTSLWTNHADLVQWKKTLFGAPDLMTSSHHHPTKFSGRACVPYVSCGLLLISFCVSLVNHRSRTLHCVCFQGLLCFRTAAVLSQRAFRTGEKINICGFGKPIKLMIWKGSEVSIKCEGRFRLPPEWCLYLDVYIAKGQSQWGRVILDVNLYLQFSAGAVCLTYMWLNGWFSEKPNWVINVIIRKSCRINLFEMKEVTMQVFHMWDFWYPFFNFTLTIKLKFKCYGLGLGWPLL